MDLINKKAIVFGGTSGIGLATVKILEIAGAEVVAIGRSSEKKSQLPNGVKFVACDVRDEMSVKKLLEKLAPFDILISSATGGERAIGPFLEMDMDGFKGSFDKLWGYANVVWLLNFPFSAKKAKKVQYPQRPWACFRRPCFSRNHCNHCTVGTY